MESPAAPKRPARAALAAIALVALALAGGALAGAPASSDEPGAAGGSTAAAPASPARRVAAPHVGVELVAQDRSAAPARALRLGVRFLLEPGWHVYWKNPGDSGLAPRVRWKLPPGWTGGEIQWPVPERIAVGPLVDYGYSGDVLLPASVTPGSDAPPGGSARVAADVEWLVCREDCLPGRADLALDVPVAAGPAEPDREHAGAFAAALARLPRAASPGAITATADDRSIRVRVASPSAHSPPAGEVAFFPATPGLIDNAAPQEVVAGRDGLELVLRRSPQPQPLPARLDGVLVESSAGAGHALAVDAPLALASAPAPDAIGSAAGARPDVALSADGASFAAAIALAFAGGLLLNLMPCVFPVLSLKVLDFARQAGGDARRLRRHGVAYAAGIVLSFWILAGALLALRAAGGEIGWGFQLQSPAFVAFMALLLFALALSLLGIVDVGVAATGWAGRFAGGTGLAGSFSTGVLATVLATPCTAPFMGTALGAALVLPPVAALAVFTALAVGMAAPYVALAFAPGAVARLPRPGPWMESIKQALAFPLLATVIWLVWVRAEQGPTTAILALLSGILLVGMALWLVGRAGGAARPASRAARGAAVALAALGLAVAVAVPAPDRAGAPGDDGDALSAGSHGDWQPFSAARLESLRAAGRPVFVDFTAAWCLTCQVNERVALAAADVRRAFVARGVALLRADWTSRDPDIARALEGFGKAGVPLYVLFPSGDGDAPPEILPSLLTPRLVIEALGRLPLAGEGLASAATASGPRSRVP
ncbi:MAG TPA: thioredoxin family protein [Burkholderiales bacterium]|nr:thioredoxin family protein [Burkholderiales bacterium]